MRRLTASCLAQLTPPRVGQGEGADGAAGSVSARLSPSGTEGAALAISDQLGVERPWTVKHSIDTWDGVTAGAGQAHCAPSQHHIARLAPSQRCQTSVA